MKLSTYIRKSWDYINTPSKWIRGAEHDISYGSNGQPKHTYCSIGALKACSRDLVDQGVLTPDEAEALYERAYANLGDTAREQSPPDRRDFSSIVGYNDNFATHDSLHRVWNATAEKLERTDH